MSIAKRYKQTEVGVIPEDWVIKELGEILKFGSGKDYKQLSHGDYPVYGTGGIMTQVNGFLYYGESVGIGRKGTIDKPVFLNGKFWTVDTLFYTHTFNNVLPKFIYYKFLQVKWKDHNEASGVPSLNKNTLDKIKIAIPPLHEQTAIANALSDMDALIAQTEKLIEKKKAIKQGVMQELLKPKEGWVTKKLGDCCQLITKGTTPTSIGMDFKGSGVNFLKIESLDGDGKIIPDKVAFIDAKTNELLKRSQIKAGDILFSIAGFLGRIALVNKNIIPANTNQALAIIRLKIDSELQNKYLFWYLNHSIIQNHINTISVQGAQANLSLQNISDFEILVPSPQTQIAISEFLTDIEDSIQTIITKLQKLKNQKQGMMQALLTGKIRLV